jgi:hypothetical protein
MTLTEAIKHCEDVADYDCFTDDQRKCSDEHRQLADWLRELKERREKAQLSGEDATFDLISRQAAIDLLKQMRKDGDMIPWEGKDVFARIRKLPSAESEIIHCWECIYYDPEHIEKNGVRYEYEDMPKDAFDILGTGLVNSKYGINVGGRCCRDYNVGYSEDKRVYVSKQNYCGRAERRTDE